MKDLGIIEDKEDIFRKCHDYISYGTLSDCADNEELVGRAVGHHAFSFCYSDYGGDEFDNICCSELHKRGSADVVDEKGPYNGMHTLVFGELADSIVEAGSDPYDISKAIGFDLDAVMTELENKFVSDATDYMLDDLKDDFVIGDDDYDWLYNWIAEHGHPVSTRWDFSASDCEKAFADYKGVDGRKNTEEDTIHEDAGDITVGRLLHDESGICTLLLSDGDSFDIGSEADAKLFCERHGIKLISESAVPVTEAALDDFPTPLEYGMVVAREKAKEIEGYADRLTEIIDKNIDTELSDIRWEAHTILAKTKWATKLIMDMAEITKDKLANAEKSYAEDIKPVEG